MSPNEDPLKPPPRRPYEPRDDDNPYWGRPSLLGWYGGLGMRGKLAWFGGILTAANGGAFLFGFYWPRMLILGIAALLASLLLPSSMDD
jgi:hypothetical protein